MRLANSRRGELSRFRILELLSEGFGGSTCAELAKRTGNEKWKTRSFRASLTTRLRRLKALGLVNRSLDRFFRPARSRRVGIYRWNISAKGINRLAWAREKGWI
jgi:hypothetical protein